MSEDAIAIQMISNRGDGNQVLIISNPEDGHLAPVVKKIKELGAEPVLFFPEKVGQEILVTLECPSGAQTFAARIATETSSFDLGRVYSIWYRRPRAIDFKADGISAKGAEFAQDECNATLEGAYGLLTKPLWVSHPLRLREAMNKPLQLAIASQLGFAIPRTCITNDPVQAKAFFRICDGAVVAKPIGAGWMYSEDETAILHVLTNRVSEVDLDASREIKNAPVMFQEEIPKAYELRVNVVGNQVLAIKIESQRSELSKVDWRRYDIQNTPYLPYELPSDLRAKCTRLTAKLGLEFGAIDLIRKPDGAYVFLEINGNGQFLWAEDLSGVQVSEALARLLAGVAPPLRSTNIK